MVALTVLATLVLSFGNVQAGVLNSCSSYCHGMPPRDSIRKANPHFDSQSSAFLGNHRNHLPPAPVAADCTLCHIPVLPTDFSHQTDIISMVNSLKGYSSANIRAKYDKGTFFNQTSVPNFTNATCSNVSCHFESKTPVWGSPSYAVPADCNSCHGFPPVGVTGTPAGGLAGSHPRHNAFYSGTTGCQKCHPGYTSFTHASSAGRSLRVQGYLKDPLNNLETGATYSGAGTNYLPSKSSSQIFGSCNNVYCHSSAQGSAGTGAITYQSPAWGGGSLTCGSCHKNMATDATATGSHQIHATTSATANGTGVNLTCQVCHGLSYSRTMAPVGSTHANKTIELFFSTISGANGLGTNYNKSGSFAPGSAYGQCSASACHGSGKPVWGANTTRPECFKCHGSTVAAFSTVSAASVAPGFNNEGRDTGGNSVATSPRVGAHQTHLTATDNISGPIHCGECHTPHLTVKDTTHLNYTTATVSFGPLAKTAGHAPGVSRSAGVISCANTYCHNGNRVGATAVATTPIFTSASLIGNTTIADTCTNKCHGMPPGASVAGDTHAALTGAYTTPTSLSACSSQTGGTGCHPTLNGAPTLMTNIFFDKTKHINGSVEAAGGHAFPYGGSVHRPGGTGSPLANASAPYTNCSGCHDTSTASGIYPVASGVKPLCSACHVNTATFTGATPGCYDCHGSSATNGMPSGGAFPNLSGSHSKHVVGQALACSVCHAGKGGGVGDTTHGSSNRVAHTAANPFVNVTSTTAQFHFTWTGKGTCANVACHGTAEWGVTKFNCLTCHSVAVGARAAVVGQFASQSHHIQGAETLTTAQCYKCHWEAKIDGSVDSAYHSGTAGKGVSLVVWNGAVRPTVATMGTTYISYTANGSRSQIAKLNQVCLGCHNSAGISAANLFGTFASDQYSPEPRMQPALARTSILSRYSSTRTVAWSNYNFTNSSGQVNQYGTNQKYRITKALSAHGNAVKNQFPAWDASLNGTGEDETIADIASATLSTKRNVFCYDCHNSHGSDVAGITSSYSSATGRYKGGLLKSTVAGTGGYTVTYKPAARTVNYKSYSTLATTAATFNAGASICHDCHNNDTRKLNIARPWSIINTYSSTRPIVGYWSTPYFDNYTGIPAKRFPYKAGGPINGIKDLRKPMGGHFASSVIGAQASHSVEINGLCTPCHDPHGVSSAMTALNRGKSVPLLKGTWVTSPYREDKATPVVKRGGGSNFTGIAAIAGMPGYNIDQNTLVNLPAAVSGGAGTVSAKNNKRAQVFSIFPGVAGNALSLHTEKTPAEFAGLCVGCHAQGTLTNAVAPAASNWMTKERVHQSVAGWAATTGTNANNTVHAFTCSKCHKAHTSHLPRLLVTDCLDVRHVKQSVSGGSISATPIATSPGFSFGNNLQSYASSAYGAGRFPSGGSRYSGTPTTAQNNGPWYFQTVQPAAVTYPSNCHNAVNAGGGATTYDPTKQIWNKKTRW